MWKEQDAWENVSQVTAPVTLLGGWYDFFLPDTLGLYQTLRRDGDMLPGRCLPWQVKYLRPWRSSSGGHPAQSSA